MSQVARIEAQATAGEIGALLVENAAIKAETPLYNRRQRQVRNFGLSISRARKITSCSQPAPTSLPGANARKIVTGYFTTDVTWITP